jgi:hypothetical protein
MQESFQRLLEQYEFLSEQIKKQTKLLRELSQTALYRERVEILRSVPGIVLGLPRYGGQVRAFVHK